MKPKFKPDWFTPFFPATLMICGVLRFHATSKSDAELLANLIFGALLIYVAFFNLYNVGRRNTHRDPPNTP